MGKRHMKRVTAPKSWNIKRKEATWILRSNPGAHNLESSMPLGIIMRDLLQLGNNMKEIRNILNNKEVLVNFKRVKNTKRPIGIMDIIELKDIKKKFRVLYNKNGKIITTATQDSNVPRKVRGKRFLKKGMQINFADGVNVLSKSKPKVGDTIVFDEKGKESAHVKLEKGSYVYLIGGKRIGGHGKIKDIQPSYVTITADKTEFKTTKNNIFAVGKDKPLITLE